MSRNSWKLAVSRGVCAVLFSAIPSFIMASPAQAQSFLTRHVRQTVISGKAKFLKRLPATQTLRLDIVLPVRDQAGMDKLFREIYDPSSPSFRHFLKGTEFMERFGPTQEDYDSLIGYLTSHGFEILRGSRDGRDVQFEGSVASIEAAFNVSMGVYQHPTEKRTFYAPDREPTVGLPFPLWHISGLDNFSIPHRAFQKNSGVVSEAGTGSGYSSSFLGSDMRAAYYGSGSLTGSGQSLALFELYFCANYIDSECYLYNGIDNADEENYFSTVGQTNSVTIVPIAVANNVPTTCLITDPCDDTEDTVDITQAVSMAPGLSDLFVFVGSSDTTILSAMSTLSEYSGYSVAPYQLSSSYTWCPSDHTSDDTYFEQMGIQGQNFFQASGDGGAYPTSESCEDSGHYTYPADDAYVTSVGGTELTTSSAGGAWSSEIAWPYSGGGYNSSDGIGTPWWQEGAVYDAGNGGSTTYRNAPDVSANATSFFDCADQQTCIPNSDDNSVYVGTSFAAPMWAGYMALVNQQEVAYTGGPLGFINPSPGLYLIGIYPEYDAFHDITSGNNDCCGQSTYYDAETGYDLVTGWGSPKSPGLINALAPSPYFALDVEPNYQSVGSDNWASYTITVSPINKFSGTVHLEVSSVSGCCYGLNYYISSPGYVTDGGGTATLYLETGGPYDDYYVTVEAYSGSLNQSEQVEIYSPY